jgi:hypothetical protein
MKKTISIIVILLAGHIAGAQTNGVTGLQPINCSMAEVVGAGMTTSGSGGGAAATVDLPITGTGALINGIESPEINVTMQGNTPFDVSVQASSEAFTYSGPHTSGTTMLVKDVLSIIVSSNNTGGAIGSGFNTYQPVNGTSSKKMIGSGQSGVRTFGFKYKATNIVYTITKG